MDERIPNRASSTALSTSIRGWIAFNDPQRAGAVGSRGGQAEGF
ncbi:hypothetical protein Kfla_4551 [Kribbella flavida DSM 17836]|uniref:Uncharacterized protein n=1 Tax=Kribbella flavida (strain DSM 17836 / JCM 10339 / NBRC 14399) TaxID=479435 RepID=D2PXW7_KRIFD|nr:hypothetical protein Kfla_4551 [Kribbella flavida DSM 17836]